MTWFVAIIFNQGISKRQQARDWNIMTYLNFYLQCESFERSLGLNLKKTFKTFLNCKQLQFIYKRFIARAREWERINSHSNWECTVSSFVRIDLFLSNHQKVPQIERKILSWKHDFHNFSRINFFFFKFITPTWRRQPSSFSVCRRMESTIIFASTSNCHYRCRRLTVVILLEKNQKEEDYCRENSWGGKCKWDSFISCCFAKWINGVSGVEYNVRSFISQPFFFFLFRVNADKFAKFKIH